MLTFLCLATAAWTHVHDRIEKIQVVMFALQEVIISCLYARAAHTYLQDRFAKRDKTRNAMCLLMVVQILAIAFDIAIVFMDFAGYLQLKFMSFSLVYAIKLELEFVALNQLVELSKMGVGGLPSHSFAMDAVPRVEENQAIVKSAASPAVHRVAPRRQDSLDGDMELESCGSRSSDATPGFITTLKQMKPRCE